MVKLRVKEVAAARGITKAKLSRITDLGISTVNDLWLSSRDPRFSTLVKVADALGVTVADLYEEIDEERTKTLAPAV